jgi:hypothetical protein
LEDDEYRVSEVDAIDFKEYAAEDIKDILAFSVLEEEPC